LLDFCERFSSSHEDAIPHQAKVCCTSVEERAYGRPGSHTSDARIRQVGAVKPLLLGGE
jgi:hypothetical protein